MKVGVFVGSFNPIHVGHEIIIYELLNRGIVDKIIVIPTTSYWDKVVDVDIKDRINMLKTIENENIIINETLNNKEYTYEVMDELSKYYDDLYLIIGADNIIDFDKWKCVDKLLKHHIIVVGRNQIDTSEYIRRFDSDKFILVNDIDLNISSTMIRNYIGNQDYESLNGLLNDRVIKYIEDNKLYSNVYDNPRKLIMNKNM